jgi:very-short-patch-repair endonuclease
MSHLEETFLYYFDLLVGEPKPEREYKFSSTRRWLADFAWPEHKLIVEIEGGTHQQGRHNRHQGYRNDCEKYNAATIEGWRILRYTSDMVTDDPLVAVGQVCRALGQHMKEVVD